MPWLLWSAGAVLGLGAAVGILWRWRAADWRSLTCILVGAFGLQVGSKLQYLLEGQSLATAVSLLPATLYEPGMRSPLGLLLGTGAALAIAALLRAPVLAIGDALAVGGAILLGFGRAACMQAGCCMGTVCPGWMAPMCVRFPNGSEPHAQQLRDGLLTLADAWSLPVHPLPLYFGATSLALAMVLAVVVKRAREPGAAFLWSLVVGPIVKLGLEDFRATISGESTQLMIAVPLITLAVGGALALWWTPRTRRLGWPPAAVSSPSSE